MAVTTSSNSENIPIQIRYKTPSRLKPKSWKLVTQWQGNASFSHMSFLDLDPHSLYKLNYILINHICLSQHPQNHRISLIQIWYKTTSRLKPKSMKTSDTRAWVCKPFIYVFMIFIHKEHVEIILQIHTSCIASPLSWISYKCPHTNLI